ncbi:MAG: lysylphosphatidylglycerol synthase transmembrane domain-containing protein [Candidatus Heimdallarchaeaceae archaeon]
MTKTKSSKKAFKVIRNFLAIIITVGLIIFLIFRFKPRNIAEAIRTLDIWVILVAILIMITMFVIKIIRWLYILRKLNVTISFLQTTQLVLIGAFGASITPAKIGDVVRALYLSNWTETKESTSFFSAILDRVTDLLSIGIFSLVALPFFITQLEEKIKWAIAGGLLIVAVILLLMFNSQIIRRIVVILSKLRKRKPVTTNLNEEKESFEEIQKPNSRTLRVLDDYYSHLTYFTPKSYVIIISLSLLFWILLGIQVSLLITSMANITLTIQVILTITGIMALAAIVSLIPISISGIGIRDATITVLVFYSLAIDFEVAFGASIIQTAVNMLLPALIGGLILLFPKWKKHSDK